MRFELLSDSEKRRNELRKEILRNKMSLGFRVFLGVLGILVIAIITMFLLTRKTLIPPIPPSQVPQSGVMVFDPIVITVPRPEEKR